MRLRTRAVEKPWGRTDLRSKFGPSRDRRVGEIWFEHPQPEEAPLLVKYIFTSEKLSVQVHPSDERARDRGFSRGKNEFWYILEADPGSTLGLGLKEPTSEHALRAAAIDGSIEQLMHWRTVRPGDFFYVPAGTIHAIGAGIALVEIQQNTDITYRLFDYGRPRELHLDDGVVVSDRTPYAATHGPSANLQVDGILLDEEPFSAILARPGTVIPQCVHYRQRWVVPLEGTARSGLEDALPGDCMFLEGGEDLNLSSGGVALIAVEGRI